MSLLSLLSEGLTQAPNMSSNYSSSFFLLVLLTVGPLPLVNSTTVSVYLVAQLLWSLLLWLRSVMAVGSQSVRRVMESEARAAALVWLDVLRFAVAGWVCRDILRLEIGVQVCEMYSSVIALRTLFKPVAYVLLRVYGGADAATRFTGFDPVAFMESVGWRSRADASSGPAWKQHGQSSKKATSADTRQSSLATAASGSDVKNNNDRCVVLDEGPHFNRTARGCLLKVDA